MGSITAQQGCFFAIIGLALFLLMTDKLRQDVVAVLIIMLLYASSLLTSDEALSGFGSEAAITVAAVFVLGGALGATGVSELMAAWIGRVGSGNYYKTIAIVMPLVAILSAFTHHVTTTALMVPVLLEIGRKESTPPSKLLLPLSIAASFGTTITIIGAPAFLIANGVLKEVGRGGLGIFSIAPIGVALSGFGTMFVLLLGWHLLPTRKGPEDTGRLFQLDEYLTELTVLSDSPHLGKRVRDLNEDPRLRLRVIGLLRGKRDRLGGDAMLEEKVREGDVLLIKSKPEELVTIRKEKGVELHPLQQYGSPDEETPEEREEAERKFVQAVIAPRSEFVGRSVAEIDFRKNFGVIVIGLWRKTGWLAGELSKTRLRPGDVLLLQGMEEDGLTRIQENRAFLLLVPFETESRRPRKGILAAGIMAGAVAATAMGIASVEMAVLGGALLVVLTRCLGARRAYDAIDGRVYVFIAGAVPLGLAMQKCGASALVAQILEGSLRGVSEFWVLMILFVLVAVLTQFMSDAATTAIFAPVAAALGAAFGRPPEPYVVTVAMASVTAFLTPIGHHGNLLIYGPGGYRFADFLKIGIPLTAGAGVIVASLSVRLWG